MPKKLLGFVSALLAALLLAGCYPLRGVAGMRPGSAAPVPTAAPQPEPDPDASDEPGGGENYGSYTPGLTAAQRAYGSAGLLAWPGVLYSIYLDEAGGVAWSEEELAQSRQNLAIAVDWITEQAAGYGINTTLYHDTGADGDPLFWHTTVSTAITGEEGTDDSDSFYQLADILCASVDTAAIAAEYGTSSIGFLLFLPTAGGSFTMVHYLEDDAYYYNEYSVLYAYDVYADPGSAETPTVYAHEILHLFGAPDLYAESGDHYVTRELADYVAETWPDEIMLDVYEADGSLNYQSIHKEIGPLTAYRLGLCSSFAAAERFPGVTADPPGVFTADGTAGSLFDDGAVAARPGA